MMKAIYNAFYLSIFLYFLRVFLSKVIIRSNGKFNLYLAGCERKNRTFTVLVASSTNYEMIVHMANYLERMQWSPTIAKDGCYFPRERCPIIPISDPELKDLFSRTEYKEIVGALTNGK